VRLQFGDCTLDSDTREITRRGKSVHVEPKAYQLLELLLDSRPKALSKDELLDALWPRTFVSEPALSRLVSLLRDALGDGTKEPRLIRTVHRFGYAFCGDVERIAGPSPRSGGDGLHCRLLMGDRQVPLTEGENLIGRDPDSAVWIDKASVSRRHARIRVGNDTAILEDLGSRNGTSVNGSRIESPTTLATGDSIKVGATTLVFRASRGLGTTASEISSHVSGPAGRRS